MGRRSNEMMNSIYQFLVFIGIPSEKANKMRMWGSNRIIKELKIPKSRIKNIGEE